MVPGGLSFEQAPPISVPFRFFLTAPLFLLLAAAVLAWRGPEVLMFRHLPASLAVTHLITLGVLAMVMCGALMQMMPVVAGSPICCARGVAATVHAGLTAGVLLLAAYFLWRAPLAGQLAWGFLVVALSVFLAALFHSLWRVAARNATVAAIGFAVAALAVTAVFGLTLLLARLGAAGVPYSALAALHPLWGLLGWVGVLVVGVAYQVVPMFQLTPNYPPLLVRWLAGGVFAALGLRTAAQFFPGRGGEWLALAADAGLAVGVALFALTTLSLQHRRRRRKTDATVLFWRVSMAALLLAAAVWLGGRIFPGWRSQPMWLGVLTIAGFALAAINGMLYKIMPFLAWFHLSGILGGRRRVPNMKELLPEARARGQFWTYVGSLGLMLGALAAPKILAYPAAALLAVNACWLWLNLWGAYRLYRRSAQFAGAEN
ncbi:MAG TPA: hypothetical protein DEP05_00770 [Betaproteobacteria bacterium]|nr:hypothetical protein [Betaproteobacteria bacterium]